MIRRVARVVAGAAVIALSVPAVPATAAGVPAIDGVFTGMPSPPVACSVRTDPSTPTSLGQRWCGAGPSRVASWDGTPIDVSVTLPPGGARDGDFPVIAAFHGWGGHKMAPSEISVTQHYVQRGYAVFSMTDRGWGQSCGTPSSRTDLPGWASCDHGYNHLGDQAYEVRDAQYLLGRLADEGVIDPNRIGAVGDSYGGILSVELAALDDRTRLPGGALIPWTSPSRGIPMRIAAATPHAFASDIASAMFPNGSTLDYVAGSPYFGPRGNARVGIQKATIANGFYDVGLAQGYYAPAGADPSADMTDWVGWTGPPGPFDTSNAIGAIDELTAMHSAYDVDDTVAPAPMLMSEGFWDDSFPADEAVRYYNRIRTDHPGTPVAMFLGDVGHARSAARDEAADQAAEDAWLDYYVRGRGQRPAQGVETYAMTCPTSAPDGGPYSFPSYAAMERGEVRLQSRATRTIQPTGARDGDQLSQPAGTSCTRVDGADNPATANYRTGPAPDGGYTVAGSATVIATFDVRGPSDQIAARLLDVGPDGREQLVERGLFRPQPGSAQPQVFQLHPNVLHVAEGHVLKLELLPDDAPYSIANPSSPDQAAQHPIQVSDLQLRVPTMDPPGSAAGLVGRPAEKLLPPGYRLAAGFRR